jgi:hypothetical protein
LTALYTPKSNERVNRTIEDTTIKAITYDNVIELKSGLDKFLILYYHGSLKRESKVRISFEIVQWWYRTRPEIIKKTSRYVSG